MKKIALFHPWIKSKGGAEKVLLEIISSNNWNIDVYTWYYDKDNTFSEFKKYNIIELGPKFIRGFSRNFLLRGLFLFSSLFTKIPLEKYDLFFLSTSGVGEFVLFRNNIPCKTYAYVHTPLRAASKDVYVWNMKNRYYNIFSKAVYFFAVKVYSFFEKMAWKKIDVAIFNSSLSKTSADDKKLKYTERKLLSPPVDMSITKNINNCKYFLYISRFSLDKRQNVLLDAWADIKHNDYKLILLGGIENKNYFNLIKEKSKQSGDVEIYTNVSHSKKQEILNNCSCGVFLGFNEDFGIVPFEYLSYHKPVILSDCGGYMDILNNKKGIYFVSNDNLIPDLKIAFKKQMGSSKKIEDISYIRDIDSKHFIKNLELIIK